MILGILYRILILMPVPYWVYLILSDSIGAEPAKVLNHQTGDMALYLLFLNLFVGVLIAIRVKIPIKLRFLVLHRRFLGVISFVYLVFHLLLYMATEGFESQAFTQMMTKTYLICSTLAWLIFFIMTITSNNLSVRWLGGRKWKAIHRLVHVAMVFVTIHVLLIEKADLVKFGLLFALYWGIQLARKIKLAAKSRTTILAHPAEDHARHLDGETT